MITFHELDMKEVFYGKTEYQIRNFLIFAMNDRNIIQNIYKESEKINFLINNYRLTINYTVQKAFLWFFGADRLTLKGVLDLKTSRIQTNNNWKLDSLSKEIFSWFFEVDGLTFMLKEAQSSYYQVKIEGHVI